MKRAGRLARFSLASTSEDARDVPHRRALQSASHATVRRPAVALVPAARRERGHRIPGRAPVAPLMPLGARVVAAHARQGPDLGADELVLDLEDAVAAAAKDAAREQVVAALASGAFGDATVSVRVNAPGTPWCHSDLIALAGTEQAVSVVVPKVGSPADLHFVDRLLDGAEAAAGRAVRCASRR